jgi:hypothetical protein
MDFLSPLASLVALAVVLPLAAFALLELRARRVSRVLTLEPPALRSRLGVPAAIACVAGLLGIAAAQPVITGKRTRVGRADVEVYILFDTSRSMLATQAFGSPQRLERAKRLALRLRRGIGNVPVGIATLTDRMLPHLFPTLDGEVFASTLKDAIGIERPPPAGTEVLATDYNSLSDAATNNYYKSVVDRRVLVVMSDGESRYFDDVVLARELRKGKVRVVFVHLWNRNEKVFLKADSPDPAYGPDPEAAATARRIARAGNGEVIGEDPSALVRTVRAYIGSGPAAKVREQRTRVSLGPYVALMSLLPLSFLLVRRNL